MRRLLAVIICIALIISSFLVGIEPAFAASVCYYEYVGLGGNGDPLCFVYDGTDIYSGTDDGHIYRYDGGNTIYDTGEIYAYDVNALEWDGSNIYAGCGDGRIYCYYGGTTWVNVQNIGTSAVNDFAWTGTNMYAGCNSGHVKRYDGGSTWTETGSTGDSDVNSLAWNGTNLYAGCDNGHVYRYDGGTTWTDTGDTGGTHVKALAWDGSNIYAGCYNDHMYRYDGGTTWTDCGDTGGTGVNALIWNATNLYAGASNGNVYRYDGGTTWTDCGNTGSSDVYALGWDGSNLYAGCSDETTYVYGGGTTWNSAWATGGLPAYSLLWNGAYLYAMCQERVYQHAGGNAWTDIGDPTATYPTNSCIAWDGSNIYVGSSSHVYRHDSGTTWTDAGSPVGSTVNALEWDGSNLYAGCQDDIYRYDGGTTWTNVGSAGGETVNSLLWNNTNLFAGTSSGHVFQYGGGTTWTNTGPASGSSSISGMVWNGTNIYIGCNNRHVFRYDGGSTWTDTGETNASNSVRSIAWDGTNIWAGCYNGYMYRYDGGTTWTSAGCTKSSAHVDSLEWDGTNLYAGCRSYGVFRKDPPRSISNCNPAQGAQGHTMNVDITGTNTHFVDGASRATFSGTGITVNSTQVTDATHATVNITIAPSAMKNLRDVNVVTGSEAPDELEGGFEVKATPPEITSIAPTFGAFGSTLTINGTGFGSSRGSSTVNFGATAASTYPSWSNTQIEAIVPSKATGTCNVTVTTSNGTSNAKSFRVVGYDTWYLAEGTSDYGFETYITIENPNDTEATADVTYMTKSGPETREPIVLAPMSQTVINPRNDIGATDFSTKVVCREGHSIAVDRRMIWQGTGALSPDGHCSIGVTSPAETWYLAEGSASWGFECWLLIQNPNDTEATCEITYMIENVGPRTVEKKVAANSRNSFNMADDMPDVTIKDASIKVESDVPVIPERSMYRNSRREGHCSIGTTTPANDYYLAEGTTDWGFTTYVLVQNPNDAENTVTVSYMTPEGLFETDPFTMPANSRKTIKVNDVQPSKDLSTHVEGTLPIIAERAMYWDAGLGEACHDSIGMPAPHTTFYLPDGETYNGTETWTLIQNPNDSDVEVEISYLTPTGEGNNSFTDTIPANSRKSFNMGDKIPAGRAAIMVECQTAGKKIMVERAMYWNSRGAGTDTIGGYSD